MFTAKKRQKNIEKELHFDYVEKLENVITYYIFCMKSKNSKLPQIMIRGNITNEKLLKKFRHILSYLLMFKLKKKNVCFYKRNFNKKLTLEVLSITSFELR